MRIQDYLRYSGQNLSAFAKKVGISSQAMSRYAGGLRTPRPDIIARIVAASDGLIQPNDFYPVTGRANAADEFLRQNPDIRWVDLVLSDFHGIARGKRISPDMIAGVAKNGIRMSTGMFPIDVNGENVPGTGLVMSTGEEDRLAVPADGRLLPTPWSPEPAAQMLMTMINPDGAPFFCDPRGVLQSVLRRFRELKLTPVIAPELEFYIFDRDFDENGRPLPPRSPLTGRREHGNDPYSIDQLYDFAELISAIDRASADQAIKTKGMITEYGAGQFEINLNHQPDAVAACDEAFLFRRTVGCTARALGFEATFMGKPTSDQPGNGFHIHFSLLDEGGRNLFDGGNGEISQLAEWAIGGMLATMPQAMAIFAPNMNAYRRYQYGSYAPMTATWGYENRFVSLRVPGGDDKNRRIEHRVAAADANPYLLVAAILAGAHHGIVNRIAPPPYVGGNAYDREDTPKLPRFWPEALDRWDQATLLHDYFGPEFCRVYGRVKRIEMERFFAEVSSLDYRWYMNLF